MVLLQLGPEEVLAEMDAGEKDNPVLHHLKQINNHLSSLALTANSLLPPTSSQKTIRYVVWCHGKISNIILCIYLLSPRQPPGT